jgi:hypothetical protein
MILEELDKTSTVHLILAGAPRCKRMVVKEYTQGRRSEYAPFDKESRGFGESTSMDLVLLTCGKMVHLTGPLELHAFEDYKLVHKTIFLLKQKQRWKDESSRSMEDLQRDLIRIL